MVFADWDERALQQDKRLMVILPLVQHKKLLALKFTEVVVLFGVVLRPILEPGNIGGGAKKPLVIGIKHSIAQHLLLPVKKPEGKFFCHRAIVPIQDKPGTDGAKAFGVYAGCGKPLLLYKGGSHRIFKLVFFIEIAQPKGKHLFIKLEKDIFNFNRTGTVTIQVYKNFAVQKGPNGSVG